jgi:hypothetical protein
MTDPGASPDLDVYDLAFLAGGPTRVVDTAVVALVRSGRLRLHSPGHLATADLTRRHPVEAAVLDGVGPTGHRSVDTIHWRVLGDDRLTEIGKRLRARRLIGGAVLAGLGGGRGAAAATRAGRQLLEDVHLSDVDAEAMRVALGGRAAMADAQLRTAIFEPPNTTQVIRRGRRWAPRDYSNDPQVADNRTNAAIGMGFGIGGGIGGADGS